MTVKRKKLLLVGASFKELYEDYRRHIEGKKGNVITWWSFHIRENWLDNLRQQVKLDGKFSHFIYLSKSMGGSGKIEYACDVVRFGTGRESIEPPNPPPVPDIFEEHDVVRPPPYKTWFEYSAVRKLDRPMDLRQLHDIDLRIDKPLIPSQLRNSFGYAY